MRIFELLGALGMDTAVDNLVWWALGYFFIFNVVLGLLAAWLGYAGAQQL